MHRMQGGAGGSQRKWGWGSEETCIFNDPVELLSYPTLGKGATSRLYIKMINVRGAWVAQSVKCPTSTQVMISQFVRRFEPRVGLSTQHRVCFRSSVPLPLCPCPALSLSLSLSLKTK